MNTLYLVRFFHAWLKTVNLEETPWVCGHHAWARIDRRKVVVDRTERIAAPSIQGHSLAELCAHLDQNSSINSVIQLTFLSILDFGATSEINKYHRITGDQNNYK